MKNREPWDFCETPKEKCTMNYCDENGCQNRKRNYVGDNDFTADVSTRTFSRNEVDRLLKVQRDKCAARATHFANEKVDSPKIFNYVNSTPIEDF